VHSTHAKRLLTAGVALPFLILVMFKGQNAGFAILVALTAALGLLEYYTLFLPEETFAAKVVGMVLGLALLGGFYAGKHWIVEGLFVLMVLAMSIYQLSRFQSGTPAADRLGKHVMGFAYVPFFLGHLILLRNGDQGIPWTAMVLAVVFAGDTAAYYVGKTWGRRKLAPKISPGKTIEGGAAGMAAALLAGALVKRCWLPEMSWFSCVWVAASAGVAAQLGDLVESMLKRSVNIKDSGRLLPGHGGILDRIDGLLFAAPVVYYFKVYLT
jgi:phosphatidate cytidylyltransferase